MLPMIETFARAAAVALVVACGPAQSAVVVFAGSGDVTGPGQVPPQFTGLTVDPSSTSYTLDGQSGWTLSSLFEFNIATLTGGGTATFTQGADSIIATFTSQSAALGAPLELSYTVTGGTGAYDGFSGSGTSLVQLLGNPFGLPVPVPFQEFNGVLDLHRVPVPGPWLLLAAAGLALTLRRRLVPQPT